MGRNIGRWSRTRVPKPFSTSRRSAPSRTRHAALDLEDHPVGFVMRTIVGSRLRLSDEPYDTLTSLPAV